MSLNPEDLIKLCDVAIAAAKKAGKHIAETRPADVQHKDGGDTLASQVLTEVDGQSQTLILDVLKPTFAQFDLALLTEESEDDGSRLKKPFFWCIDPIDGTLPYIEGVPGYAVSIALVSKGGEPVIGVVYDPVEHILYHAIKNQGAFRNLEPWKLCQGTSGRLQLFTDRSVLDQPWFAAVMKQLDAEVGAVGGGVMNAIRCLEHPPAAYFKLPKEEAGGGSLWDFAATACIYHELGAIATDMHGIPLDLNRTDSTFMNRCGILYATDATLAQRIMALF